MAPTRMTLPAGQPPPLTCSGFDKRLKGVSLKPRDVSRKIVDFSGSKKESCVMTDDRSNGAFDHSHSSGNEPWASLIAGTQDWVGRCSSTIHDINTQWIDFFHKRVEEDFALPQHLMSCAIEVWSAHTELLQTALAQLSNVLC